MAPFKVALLVCLLPVASWAQTDRYIVFFRDKNNNTHSVDMPLTFLSQRALDRRVKAGVLLTADDLPVTASYVAQVGTTGAETFFTSRWLNVLLIEATPPIVATVEALPFVLSVEKVAPNHKLTGGRIRKLEEIFQSGEATTDAQLEMLGIDEMHDDGYKGDGVMIALVDSGFPGVNTTLPFQAVISGSQLLMTKDFVTNSGNVFQFYEHGTVVFSTIAAQSDVFDGGAPLAKYLLFATEDAFSEYRVEEYNWLFAAELADSAGSDIIQSSLGYSLFDDSAMDYALADLDGETAVVSKAAAFARDRGIIVVTSAGNEGSSPWRYIIPPADVDGILSVGAVTSVGTKASFSSVGPTADGRVKPDVVALGQGVASFNGTGDLGFSAGTSLSAPLVTSLVAGMIETYPLVKPGAIVDAIRFSASQAANPDNNLGYGIPNYRSARNYMDASESEISIYTHPNPVADTLWINFKNLIESPVDIAIYDYQGKTITTATLGIPWTNNALPVIVSGLSEGLYLLTLKTATLSKTFRFVKL